jgi:hypothetical protein
MVRDTVSPQRGVRVTADRLDIGHAGSVAEER